MLWGISWLNVEIMLHDSARVVDNNSDNPDGDSGEVVKRDLKTKDDIKNYIKGLM